MDGTAFPNRKASIRLLINERGMERDDIFLLSNTPAIDRMKWLVRDFRAVYGRNTLGGAGCWRGCFA